MAQINFGNQVPGASTIQFPPGENKAVCRVQNTTGQDLAVERFIGHWGFADYSTAKMKAVIYSDNAGSPNALLATSNEQIGGFAAFKTFTFATPLTVAAGAYVWIGVISDTTVLAGFCTASGSIYYNADTYSDGPSATFGSASIAGYTYQMWVEGDDGQLRFGRSSVDAGSGNYQLDNEHGEPFVLGGTSDVDVTSISTYVQTTSATVKSKAAIFTDSAGLPGTKVAQTVEVTGATANSWLTLNFSSPVRLSPGTYWLCFIADTNLVTPIIGGGGLLRVDGSEAESTAWSSSITFLYDRAPVGLDIYASYTVVAAGPTPISGEVPISITGVASLKLGTSLAGAVHASVTGGADLATGTHLAATGRIEATPRGRLAGATATPGAGNFFLLF